MYSVSAYEQPLLAALLEMLEAEAVVHAWASARDSVSVFFLLRARRSSPCVAHHVMCRVENAALGCGF